MHAYKHRSGNFSKLKTDVRTGTVPDINTDDSAEQVNNYDLGNGLVKK